MTTEEKKAKRTYTRKTTGAEGRKEGSPEARRAAAMILEVLAGTVSASQAAGGLGVSLVRYFVLESRAINGMITACEPRPRGYVRTADNEIERLKKEQVRLQRECARYQALARMAQRTIGVSVPKKEQTGVRKRKPVARALKLAQELKEPGHAPAAATVKDKEGPALAAESRPKA